MKRYYSPPVIEIIKTASQLPLLADSIDNITGNGDVNLGGGGTEPAHAPQRRWEEWEEWK